MTKQQLHQSLQAALGVPESYTDQECVTKTRELVNQLQERPNDGRTGGRCGIRMSSNEWCVLNHLHSGDHWAPLQTELDKLPILSMGCQTGMQVCSHCDNLSCGDNLTKLNHK